MNGAGIRRPSHARKAIEAPTMTTSHRRDPAVARSYRPSSTSARRRRKLGGLGRAGLDPDLRRRRSLAEHRIRHRLTPRGLLERGHVQVGGAREVVLTADEVERGRRHRRARRVVAGEQLEPAA